MALWSAQVLCGADSGLARDYFVNTVHFNGVGTFLANETDVQSIANDLVTAWKAFPNVGTFREVRAKVYNLDDAQPRPLRAEAVANAGAFPASTHPREVALCLSYYADRNLKRHRGRLYIPLELLGAGAGVRPTAQQMTDCKALYTRLVNLGGTDLEWSVFSRMDNVHRQVQHGWVDDEWDVIRSRGLRATTRQTVDAEG